jgi:hypothetical protein
MSSPAAVHKIRQKLGIERQPLHADSLGALDTILQRFPRDHPYSLETDHFPALCEVSAFGEGPAGRKVGAPAAPYLYRLTSVRNIARDVTRWRGRISPTENSETLFRYFQSHAAPLGGWYPLADLADGYLRGPRGFTWWSTHEISSRYPLRSALRLGLPYDYTPVYAAILRFRCGSGHMPTICVPSAVDAFDHPVFRPTDDGIAPAAGLTIQLSATRTFSDGETEYCIGDVPVEPLEVYPVLINETHRSSPGVLTDTPEFWQHLETYYRAL